LLTGSGLEEIFQKSGILLPASAKKALTGKRYYRCLRAHLIVVEAFFRLYWDAFEQFSAEDENVFVCFDVLNDSINKLLAEEVRLSGVKEHLESMSDMFDKFEDSFAANSTARLWIFYIRLVLILVQFLVDERAGNWVGHLTGVKLMAPYFSEVKHHKYAAFVIRYLSDMRSSPTELSEIFRQGLFNVKRLSGKMNSISPYHALESTLNLQSGPQQEVALTASVCENW
jgi:hypothetical protein